MLTNLYCKLTTLIASFKNDERGVTAIEYGLIAAAMAAVLATAFYTDSIGVNDQLVRVFKKITDALASATGISS